MRPVEVSLLSLNIRHLAGAQNACPAGSDFSGLQRASPSLGNGGLRPASVSLAANGFRPFSPLRGRCPLPRYAWLPRTRRVAGGWGKSTPSHQPGALGSFHSVKGAGCAPGCSPGHPLARALRLPLPPLTLFHSVPGQGTGNGEGSRFNGGDPPAGWGGNRSFLTPRSDPPRSRLGCGLCRPKAGTARTPATWRTAPFPLAGRAGGWVVQRPKGGAGRSP